MYQDEQLDKIIENQVGLVIKKPFMILDIFALENKDAKITLPQAYELYNSYLSQLFDYLILEASNGVDMVKLLTEYKEFIANADETLLNFIFQSKEIVKDAKEEAKEQGLTIRNWLAKNMNQVNDDFGVLLEEYQYEIYRK